MFARPVHPLTRLRLLVLALAVALSLPTAVAAARLAGNAGTTSTPQADTRDLEIVIQDVCSPETADHVYFLGVVNDGNAPGEPREDFRADMGNIEFYLQTLRGTYCIPDAQASILAFTDGWQDDTGVPLSPYPEASEANVKAELARLGAAASQHADSIFFFFLSSHGIVYVSDSLGTECPVTRLTGSLSGLKPGNGETGDFYDCELGASLNANFAPTTKMFVLVDCSFCGGFSESLTAVSGTIPDNSASTPAGVVAPNRIVATGCAMTTECFGSGGLEPLPGSGTPADGGVSYRHLRNVLEGDVSCDGWTVPGFPDVEGFDVPVNDRALRPLDGLCTASEWFFAAVWSAYSSGDVIGIQQQFRIKYGLASLADDILIVDNVPDPDPTPTPNPTPTPTPTATPTPTPTPNQCVTTNWVDTLEPSARAGWRTGTAANELAPLSPTWSVTVDTGAHSPTNSWSNDAKTLGLKDTRLIAPTQKLGLTTQLSFWHRFLFEDGFDGGVLEVSIDGGAIWVDVTNKSSFVSGGYNGTISTEFGSAIAGRQAWTGGDLTARIDSMSQAVVSLGGFVPAGANSINAQIRWRFVADELAVGATPGDEWWVDDVQFSKVVVSCP